MVRRVVVLGVTDLTARCLELVQSREGAHVEAVAVPAAMIADESTVSVRLRDLARSRGVPVVDVGTLVGRRLDLGISVGLPQILTPEVIEAFSAGVVNLHLAPLPRYRGSLRTLSAAILNRDETFGVSLHRVDAGIDTGEVLRVREFPLPRASTAAEILPLLLEEGAALVEESLDALLSTEDEPTPVPSSTTGPSRLYPRSAFDELLTITVPVSDDELDLRRRALTWSDEVRPRLRTRDGTEIPSSLGPVADAARTVLTDPHEHHLGAGLPEHSDRYFDPVWQLEVVLSELEQELVRHPLLRRLAHVAHAGAASIMSAQTYSRLDHSLGLFALASALRPEDRVFRAAALVHDIGHPPLSHTVEKALGLDHHEQGDALVRGLAPVFARHGLRAEDVVEATHGAGPSGLGEPGAMRLDHFESYVRSALAHGRLAQLPRHVLGLVRESDGRVSCEGSAAELLIQLAVEEARRQTSPSNARANAVAGRLVRRRAAGLTASEVGDVGRMTDRELWSFLAQDAELAPEVQLLLTHPESWGCSALAPDEPVADGCFVYEIDRLYFEPPLVDGRAPGRDEDAEVLVARLPRRYAVSREPLTPRAGPDLGAGRPEGGPR